MRTKKSQQNAASSDRLREKSGPKTEENNQADSERSRENERQIERKDVWLAVCRVKGNNHRATETFKSPSLSKLYLVFTLSIKTWQISADWPNKVCLSRDASVPSLNWACTQHSSLSPINIFTLPETGTLHCLHWPQEKHITGEIWRRALWARKESARLLIQRKVNWGRLKFPEWH